MIYCSQCGREHQDRANFCGGCGNQLRATVTAVAKPKKITDKLTTKKSSPLFLIVSAILWFYLLLVPFMIYFYSMTDGSVMFYLAEGIFTDPGDVLLTLLFVDAGMLIYIVVHQIYSRLWQRSKWFKFFLWIHLVGSIVGVLFAGFKFFRFLLLLVSGSSNVLSEIVGYNNAYFTYMVIFSVIHYALFTAFFSVILTKSIKQFKQQ